MDLRSIIQKEYRSISEKQETERSKQLLPLILEHFNDYVNKVINPVLPEGYALLDARRAEYEEGRGFNVYTGKIETPRGFLAERADFDKEIAKLCSTYKSENPWIAKIRFGFYLSTDPNAEISSSSHSSF